MIDVNGEQLLSLPEAARRMPRRRAGRPCSVSTIYRWIQVGCEGVKLEAIRMGGAYVTSAEALQRFAEACTPAFNGGADHMGPAPTPRSPGRERDRRKAAAALDAAGIA